jgi:fructokinase
MSDSHSLRIGIDLGGTKTEAIALDRVSGAELARKRVATEKGSYDGTLRTVKELVEGIEAELGREGSVGIGIPGTISPKTGLVKNANSTWLIGKPFDKDLEAALGRPVRLANDADCFALSEATDGAGKGAETVFGVILGTGVGGGLVVHGRLVRGPNAVAGEWGHNPLPWPGRDEQPGHYCYCGKTGCIETFLSGPALERDFGEGVSAAEIARMAEQGRRRAVALRRPAGAGACHHHQRLRPLCDRAGRRCRQHRAALPQRAPSVGRIRVLGRGGDPAAAAGARRFVRRARRGVAVGVKAGASPRRMVITGPSGRGRVP